MDDSGGKWLSTINWFTLNATRMRSAMRIVNQLFWWYRRMSAQGTVCVRLSVCVCVCVSAYTVIVRRVHRAQAISPENRTAHRMCRYLAVLVDVPASIVPINDNGFTVSCHLQIHRMRDAVVILIIHFHSIHWSKSQKMFCYWCYWLLVRVLKRSTNTIRDRLVDQWFGIPRPRELCFD